MLGGGVALLGLAGIPAAAPSAAGGSVTFHPLPGSSTPIVADAGSSPPTAVGWLHTGDPPLAYRYTPATGYTLLADLEGSVERSRAHAISGDGRTVVGRGYAGAAEEAVRWVEDGPAEALGAPAGRSVLRSEAADASYDGGVVVGHATFSLGPGPEAFRWTPEAGMEPLGQLTAGHPSEATGVSSDGTTIVGWGYASAAGGAGLDARAFRWRRETGFRGEPARSRHRSSRPPRSGP